MPDYGPHDYVYNWKIQLKSEVIRRFGTKCYLCGRQLTTYVKMKGRRQVDILVLDHVVPESRSHDQRVENLRPCCGDCNLEKTMKDGGQVGNMFAGDMDAIIYFRRIALGESPERAERGLKYVPRKGWKGEDW